MLLLNHDKRIGLIMSDEFLGTSYHQIDSKNRIRIPSRFKLEGQELVFALGRNNRILIYSQKGFKELSEKVRAVSRLSDSRQEKAVSLFFGTSVKMEGDAQGRIILPATYMKYAKITGDIVLCGVNDHIELWAKEVHEGFFGEITPELIDEMLTSLNI